jgi:hypothetical protein
MINAQGSVPYEDIWDFYMLLPTPPPARMLDPTSIGCPPLPPPAFSDPASRRIVILAAVLGSLAGATLMAAIAICYWRRNRTEQPAEGEAVQLTNLEDLHEFSA